MSITKFEKRELVHRIHFHDDSREIGPAVDIRTDDLMPILTKMRELLEKSDSVEPVSMLTVALIRDQPSARVFNASSPGVSRFGSCWAACLGPEQWPVGGAGVFLVSVRSLDVVFCGGPGFNTSLLPDEYNANSERRETVSTAEEAKEALAKEEKARKPTFGLPDAPGKIIKGDPASALEELFTEDGDKDRPPNPNGPIQVDMSAWENLDKPKRDSEPAQPVDGSNRRVS